MADRVAKPSKGLAKDLAKPCPRRPLRRGSITLTDILLADTGEQPIRCKRCGEWHWPQKLEAEIQRQAER